MEDLLVQLRSSRSDLANIVEAAARTDLAFIVVPAGAVRAWEQREPSAWAMVREWLTSRGKTVMERDDGTDGRAPDRGTVPGRVLDASMPWPRKHAS